MTSVAYSAPGRCGIVGNPSDIYGGVVVSCAIAARAVCRLSRAEADDLPEDTTLWRAATARMPLAEVRVEWSSQVPRSSGLAGSTALLAATVASVKAMRGEPVAADAGLAELVRDLEYHEAGVVCGYQDAYMVVHGGLQRMDFAGKHPAVQGGPHAQLHPLRAQLPFLLVTTGVERLSGSVHGPIRDRWLAGEREVIVAMERAAELGRHGADALATGDWPALAEAMTENQAITASLGGSGEAIDDLIAQCLDCGARAAKLAGAGMGGTVIALHEDPNGLESRLRSRGYTRFLRPDGQEGLRREPNGAKA